MFWQASTDMFPWILEITAEDEYCGLRPSSGIILLMDLVFPTSHFCFTYLNRKHIL